MASIVLSLGIFVMIATLIPFIRSDKWWIRMFDFPHAQLTTITFACIVAFLFSMPFTAWSSLFFGLLVLAFIYQGYLVYPYTIFSPKQVHKNDFINPADSISLLSANVYMENRESERLFVKIRKRDPDIIILLETDAWWETQAQPFKKTYPYFVEKALENTYGMLLYSKYPLIDPEIKFLVEPEIPSIHSPIELPSGQQIRLHCLHPTPPTPFENEQSTERDAELLIVAKEVQEHALPTIVAGDLNDVAWSSTTQLFQQISGLLDPRIGRGFYNTFHAKIPFFRWPLDHVFHSEHFKLIGMERLPKVGSDHFPIYIHLQYHPLAKYQQETPEATPEEEKRADEKIDKVE